MSVTVLLFIRVLLCTKMFTVQQMSQRKSCARVSLENSCLNLKKTNTYCYRLVIKKINTIMVLLFPVVGKERTPAWDRSPRLMYSGNKVHAVVRVVHAFQPGFIPYGLINFFLRSILCSQSFYAFHYLSHQYQRITTRTGEWGGWKVSQLSFWSFSIFPLHML